MRSGTTLALGLLVGSHALGAQQVATVVVSPTQATVTAGDTIRFRVTAADSAGHTLAGVPTVWFATPFDIAGSDSTGLVTTTRPGQTYVFALVGGKPGFAVLDIVERPPAQLEIAAPPGGGTLVVGQVLRLTARAVTVVGDPIDPDAQLSTGSVRWRSLGPGVAEVSPAGVVRARTAGRTTIVASLGPL